MAEAKAAAEAPPPLPNPPFPNVEIAPRPYYYLGGGWGLTRLSTGRPFYVNTRDHDISPWIMMGGTWENFVDDIMQELVREGDTCFDIGANIGYYAVKLAHRVGPGGHVHAFEPNGEVHEFLHANVQINGFSERVSTHRSAVGAADGRATLNVEKWGPGGGFIETSSDGDIEVVSLDALLGGSAHVDFVKIDVEGHEPPALMGMRGILDANPQCVVVAEYTLKHWSKHESRAEALALLSRGRALYRVLENGRVRALNDGDLACQDLFYILAMNAEGERASFIRHRMD